MAIEEILREIGGFHTCDTKGVPHDSAIPRGEHTLKDPFAYGMLRMTSPHGEFRLKRLPHVTYVEQGAENWVNFSSVDFAEFHARGCEQVWKYT